MRLNRENTLIENNLQPCAGMYPEDIQKKFVKAVEPYEEYIMQFQAALYLRNIPLFAILIGTVVALFALFLTLSSFLPRSTVLIIAIPIFELFYCFDAHKFIKKFFIELKDEDENAKDKLLSLDELMAIFWKPILAIWRAGFFVYRTFVCPNPVDTIFFIIATIIVSLLNQKLCLITVFTVLFIIALVTPAILIKTPAGDYLKQLTQKEHQKKE